MLITADSGFYSWQLWDLFAATGAALCWRAPSVPLPLVHRLPDGSYLALIFAPGTTARRKAALLAAARAGEQIGQDQARIVRAAEYTVPDRGGEDSELICVITTLLDPAALTAAEMAFAYHQRWEHESGWMRSRRTCAPLAGSSAPSPLNSSNRRCGNLAGPLRDPGADVPGR